MRYGESFENIRVCEGGGGEIKVLSSAITVRGWMVKDSPDPPINGSSAVVWNPRISIFDRKWVRDILDLVWLLHKPIELL